MYVSRGLIHTLAFTFNLLDFIILLIKKCHTMGVLGPVPGLFSSSAACRLLSHFGSTRIRNMPKFTQRHSAISRFYHYMSQKVPRPRRSYSCGPCQRFKMRCDLAKPCGSCLSLRRSRECLQNPPNPPTEEEKVLIQQRKLRNRRKKDKESKRVQFARIDEGPEKKIVHSEKIQPTVCYVDCTAESCAVSVKTNSIWKLSFANRSTIPNDSCSKLKTNEKRGVEYFQACDDELQEKFYLFTQSQSRTAEMMGQLLTQSEISQLFTQFSQRNAFTATKLINPDKLLSMFLKFASFCSRVSPLHNQWYINKTLIRYLSFATLIISQSLILDGLRDSGMQWLEFSLDLARDYFVEADLNELITKGIWLHLAKPSYIMNNQISKFIQELKKFEALVCNRHALVPFEDSLKSIGEGGEDHRMVSKLWMSYKIAETEISELGCKQMFRPLQNAFSLFSKLAETFDISQLDQTPYSRLFVTIFICSRYFNRFDNHPTRTKFIYSYLLLYQEVSELDWVVSQNLIQRSAQEDFEEQLLSETGRRAMNLFMLKHFFTRLLLVVKLEQGYFPSLRFAQYVTNLMCVFNWAFHIADKVGMCLEQVFQMLMEKAYFIDVMLLYLCCGFQTIFICLMGQFCASSPRTLTIDLNYLCDAVEKSWTKSFNALKNLKYVNVRIISVITTVVEDLRSCTWQETTAKSTFDEFYESLQLKIKSENWKAMVMIWFGSSQVCRTHFHQLWRLGAFIEENGSKKFMITKTFAIDTSFFKQYERLLEPFRFSKELLDSYMRDVVYPNQGVEQTREK
ncbi:hypothetical protein PUMCH_002030 [Australozyma saopauloensis]|uniref:Zn(2)-C6 fungal-type domain-containing protein n=1 Tax=Australozyma saopauloensis TaxID=291208 RepID=A0AAX4H918_9ASCO|nr:hypothetical protein PUMCH_002030 [[Candida] saopauloensis]